MFTTKNALDAVTLQNYKSSVFQNLEIKVNNQNRVSQSLLILL